VRSRVFFPVSGSLLIAVNAKNPRFVTLEEADFLAGNAPALQEETTMENIIRTDPFRCFTRFAVQ